jgi:hypothetical protein
MSVTIITDLAKAVREQEQQRKARQNPASTTGEKDKNPPSTPQKNATPDSPSGEK